MIVINVQCASVTTLLLPPPLSNAVVFRAFPHFHLNRGSLNIPYDAHESVLFSLRLVVKVGLSPCLPPCSGPAHPRQHHPGQPCHPGHPADSWRGGPEPRGADPDDLDREVWRRAGQASGSRHTRGHQGHLQHEAVSDAQHHESIAPVRVNLHF